jgi:hypothetical protein
MELENLAEVFHAPMFCCCWNIGQGFSSLYTALRAILTITARGNIEARRIIFFLFCFVFFFVLFLIYFFKNIICCAVS